MTRAIVATIRNAASANARLAQKPGASPASLDEDDTSEAWMSTGSQNSAQYDGITCFVLFARGIALPQFARNIETGAYPATTGSSTLTQVLYLQEAGNTSAISVTDINQGQMGDCYLLASIGELVLYHPSWITQMIRVNADGTETATLYTTTANRLPSLGATSFTPVAITVTNTFPSYCVNNGATQDVFNGQKEIWVQVLEKAVATLYGGYGGIANGGIPSITMEELTGCTANYIWATALSLQQLQGAAAARDLITFDTKASGSLPYHLVNSHAYMFNGLSTVNGAVMVNLLNPWGFNQPDAIPFSQVGTFFDGIDIGLCVDTGPGIGGPGNDSVTLTAVLTNGSIDLYGGTDILKLANGTNSATISNVETIIGGTGADTIILATAASSALVDLGGGLDVLTLANGGNVLAVANVETLIGGTGNDSVTLTSALPAGTSIDLRGGIDRLTLGNAANTASIANVETILGGSAADSITLMTALMAGMAIDLGGGSDTLILAASGNSGTVKNVETIVGSAGADSITLGTAITGGSIDLRGGIDALTLANGGNALTVANVETLTGGTGADTVILATALTAAMTVDLGAGTDKLTLLASGNTGTIRNVETIIGGAGSDLITLGIAVSGASIDLGGGLDVLMLANGTNSAIIANVETIYGGSGADMITLAAAADHAVVDLGAGTDRLTLGNFANTATIANVETIVGGSLADLVTLTSALTSACSINLGAGADTLRLANLTNTGTISNVETIVGGGGNDTITLGAAATNATIDLGGGADRLMLGAFANSVTVTNVETIVGGSRSDTIVLGGSVAATVIGGGGINFITGGSGGDTFVLDQASSNAYSVVRNFGAGDRIALDIKSVSTFGTDIYNLGGASLADGTTIIKMADDAGRLAARLNNGSGAFVYQQNTGVLYYSATGNFSRGGTEIGQVTTNGITAWTYDASRFVAV